jgi:hypothetical protein
MPQNYQQIYTISAALIVLLIAGFVLLTWLRKRMRADAGDSTPGGAGFTLDELRRLHKEGKLTDNEYEKARSAIVGAAHRELLKSKPDGKQKPSSTEMKY